MRKCLNNIIFKYKFKKRHVYEFNHGGLKHKLDIKAFAHFHVKSDISSFKTIFELISE